VGTAKAPHRARGAAPVELSVVVVVHNMRREAARTLRSLAADYQLDASSLSYEVLVVDNGSTEPLDEAAVARFGRQFSYFFFAGHPASPAAAINAAAHKARGRWLLICVDGARILSPGVLHYVTVATAIAPRGLVATLGWHLGPALQNESTANGYDRAAEDELLESLRWWEDGYRLFEVSTLAASCAGGWFDPIAESNCVAVPAQEFERLGGYDESFVSPGGGLVNLDFFKRACESAAPPVVLLGEGTFHQVHGGVATNVPFHAHPWDGFAAEYRRLRGGDFVLPEIKPLYLGTMGASARRFLRGSGAAGRSRPATPPGDSLAE